MEKRPLENTAEAKNEMQETFEEEKKKAPEEAASVSDTKKEEAQTDGQKNDQSVSDDDAEEEKEDAQPTTDVAPSADIDGQKNDQSVPNGDAEEEKKEDHPAAAKKKPVVVDRQTVDREFVEKAGNRDEYITYLTEAFELSGEKLVVYAASRIGLGHIRKKTPCQDFCMYRKIPHGAVLLDADGISACDQGQVGAEFACAAAADAVERISKAISDEAEFVREICKTDFYADLREDWMQRINEHWAGIPHAEKDSALFHYGTTLFFVVITENWYVTFNLGDGQILLFNDDECMRIRLGEKAGQAPSSLIYGTYLEDVQRGVWERKRFKGVLLTTDGVYDRISCLPWYAGHHYAKQTAERFEKHGEPKAPFIYSGTIDGEERTIDVSRQRSASDDCSIVMALNGEYRQYGHDIVEEIRRHIPEVRAIQLLRCLGGRSNYLVFGSDGYRVIFAVPWNLMPVRNPRLQHFTAANVRLWECEESWITEGIHYGSYRLPEKAECNFLEGSFQCQQFHSVDQYHKVPDEYDRITGKQLYIVEPLVGANVIATWKALKAVDEHLACQNMRFNEMASMWIARVQDAKRELLIPIEALSEADMPEEKVPWVLSSRDLFPGLIGYLTYREADMPLFTPGFRAMASTYYLFGAAKNAEERGRFFRVRYDAEKKVYGLQNCSRYPWEVVTAEGKQLAIAPGKTVLMSDGCRITVMLDDGKKLVCDGCLI
ncbi:MAG: protein phosphatase 2C domain-containing protein [Clostridia bacterium]|nr:protein phosphatase 2C domain-containing protein [Clostridia bacterium]